jgi:hypothetical protein
VVDVLIYAILALECVLEYVQSSVRMDVRAVLTIVAIGVIPLVTDNVSMIVVIVVSTLVVEVVQLIYSQLQHLV